MSNLQLTSWQRRRLLRQLEQTDDVRVYQRTLAILEYAQGKSMAAIAPMLRVTRPSVYNWVEAYTHDHDPTALLENERAGRPSLWTEKLRRRLQTLIAQAPDDFGYFAGNGTVALFQEEIEHQTGQPLSDDTLRRELDRWGYVWKRSRYVLEPDPQREKKTLDLPKNRRFAASQGSARRGRDGSVALSPVACVLVAARPIDSGAFERLECPTGHLRGHELAQRQPLVLAATSSKGGGLSTVFGVDPSLLPRVAGGDAVG